MVTCTCCAVSIKSVADGAGTLDLLVGTGQTKLGTAAVVSTTAIGATWWETTQLVYTT